MPKTKKEIGGIDDKKPKVYKSLRGFRDILPDSQVYWDKVEDAARKIATDYSFDRIRLPYLEQTQLFERSVGKGTDIVDKEMFSFVDPSNTKVTLRPEATAQVVRTYIEHGMLNKPQPVKLWYFGPMFRHDRPQAGRYRQFWQFGLEAIGSNEPIIDAQIIIICFRLLKELGLDVTVQINSIGTPESRRDYIMELVSYFKQFRRQLSETDKKRLQKNPLRLLDSKEPEIQELKVDAPQIVDWLDDTSKQDFMKVLEYLDEAEVPYELNPFLVRGLDYYSKTVFEIIPNVTREVVNENEEEKSQNALGGGGRYDGLVEMLGGREGTPAMGAALGIERIILAMKAQEVPINKQREIDVFFCQLGEAARRKGLSVFEQFRSAGITTGEAFGKGSLKTQLEMADKLKAKVALILGQKEVLDGTIIIRDMESGAQEIVDVKKVVEIVQKQLGG
ncbi:histidine--tRNA ligase [Candidatus Uhrbacteria bacterium CG_4_9_14_0_2_um_filter_41_50]|uniref:Histidine--tRNA ligase n=1 Tax=Candidatus Uhrbacteria bacterium CG_4_9_14_0_2_um_filter_41_50 TaxID=1975031 RepID=A0A2M8ENS7_9BACT|nr:MAG: histidine--tRNA ligase [Candidatus Uhrbacteria bacterium CG_4_10_14_3_um_filter_41_21]PIZ54814.1 MAG: histidine--tRNA ligase [Candidatus Uhrbacteria bacterium CG_4_10_14_0_2_um_filter_41_21]PJB84605.1 MAG: histidine--tRNA ligase [Candidatus Uhrbacteria bacterium CG_4_9_14_0_8_um_filter_41_16]PJC24403.1 MAG: histidine--tRNA ligase [Candidatus Uhrbacteria bacterium CG_4_9_14_0_2_um_filter_41_50]PJE75162.1 MAG: histidine--tRNA ligase [Candidatus Uhrbacteria bacterium CG10_big_fil_rev_8_21_